MEKDLVERSAWRRFVDEAFGGAATPALRFLATEARLTKKQRAALQALLEDPTTTTTDAKGDSE